MNCGRLFNEIKYSLKYLENYNFLQANADEFACKLYKMNKFIYLRSLINYCKKR